MIQISADRQRARCVRSANERITTGLTGKAVTFRFGAGWENVTARTAVFEGSGVTRDCLIENGEATIPHECLTVPGGVLRCGVYGVEGDKKTPTVYAELGQIERGADPSGDTSTDPTLAVWAQILAKMGSLDDLTTEAKNTLVAAINEAAQTGGGGSAFSLIRSLTLTEQTDRVDITTGDGGSAFALTEVYVAVEAQSYTETAEAVIFLPNGLWTSNNPYITSSNKTTKASETRKSGMTFHAVCLGNQMAFAEQCPAGNSNNLESKTGTIGGAAITKISLVSKLAAGCTVTVYGR